MQLRADQIKLNPNNPRIIKDDKFKKLVQSLKDFPEMAKIRPVVLNKEHIILGGNMRYKAMQEAGWTDIPVTIVDWSEEKQREFIIKDNVSGGEWDWDVLANEWDTELLDEWGLDTPDNWNEKEVEEDEAPEVSSEPPVSQLGSIYQLGRHFVMCGDSTDKASVELLMAGEVADMVFTDPPYALFGNSTGVAGITDDNMVRPFFRNILQMTKSVSKTYAHIYVCCDWHSAFSIEAIAREVKLPAKNLCIWDKGDGGIGGMYSNCYEMIWFFANSPNVTTTTGKKKAGERIVNGVSNIWRYPRVTGTDREHNAAKPVDMIAVPIKAASDVGEKVLDLFLGSGSTLIACEQTDRICYGMELDPKYVDVIRKRYAKFIGEEDWEAVTPAISDEKQTEVK